MLQVSFNNRLPTDVIETGDGGEVGQLRLSLAIKAADGSLPDSERREAWRCLQALRAYESTLSRLIAEASH